MHHRSAVVAAALLGICAMAGGCSAARPPRPTPEEFVCGQVQRLIKGPIDRVWTDVIAILEEEGATVEHSDREAGVIACHPIRTAGRGRNLLRLVGRIADLKTARGRLRSISEYAVEHTVFLMPAGADTSMKIVSTIQATDRSSAIIVGPGIGQIIPVTLTLPSKGVVERQLLRRIASRLFSAEEMLYYVGDLGYE